MKKQIVFIIIVILDIRITFSQIKEISYLNEENKIVTLIDTINSDKWKIDIQTYSIDKNILKKEEKGFIKPKTKKLFYIYKKETEYFENGNKSHEFILYNNLKDSIETFWYENGQRAEIQYWNKGKKEGANFLWYQNGDIKSIEHYCNDTIIGESIWFHPKKIREKFGNFTTISKYEKGILLSYESYLNTGLLESVTTYSDTARITKIYYKSGVLQKKEIVKNPQYIYEQKNSIEEYYRKDGSLKMKVITKNGKITINEYDENGKLTDPFNFRNKPD